MEKHHECTFIKNCDEVSIKQLSFKKERKSWYLIITENLNTKKERNTVHEVLYCPWCGERLRD